ncbi:MAG TPA: RICIN domain-containing protein [Bryobacteraceae bacterium]|nr:RICIN domain-containing protein [Bryobacteraceae bacterium]
MIKLRFSRPAILALAATAAIPLAAWAQGGFNGPGRYEVTNVRSGKVIDLDRATQSNVIQFSARGTDNQQWDIAPAPNGFWYFRNGMNGAALEQVDNRNSTPVRGMPFNGNPAQQWRITPAAGGAALITNRLGKTLDIPNGDGRDGIRINTYDINGNPNQRFLFRRVAAPPPPPPVAGPDRDDWDRDHRWERYYGRFDERERRWGMEGDGACFYRQPGYRGRAFCVRAGEEVRRMPDQLVDRFRSIKLFGRVRGVAVFEEESFGGRRLRFQNDQPDLHDVRRIVSVRVF